MKLKWKVAEKPTGLYRSFSSRGWPTAYYEGGHPAASISCEDAYVPARVRSGNHSELTVQIADWSTQGRGFEWRTLKQRCSTLDEAKAFAESALEKRPHFQNWREKEKQYGGGVERDVG